MEDVKILEYVSKLQKKKNTLRKKLAEKGVLNKEGKNNYSNYTYFSESQYKLLFTELFAECGLELKFSEESYEMFTGSGKTTNGRLAKLRFTLFDVETGYGEDTIITGESMDSGDKAGYQAYTGALKYYLANTFMVATGDEAETKTPKATMNKKVPSDSVLVAKFKTAQIKDSEKMLKDLYKADDLKDLTGEQKIDLEKKLDMQIASIKKSAAAEKKQMELDQASTEIQGAYANE